MLKGGKKVIYRGSIIEVRESMLIVMLEDSTFKKVKKFSGLEEGMEIYFEERDLIKERNIKERKSAPCSRGAQPGRVSRLIYIKRSRSISPRL